MGEKGREELILYMDKPIMLSLREKGLVQLVVLKAFFVFLFPRTVEDVEEKEHLSGKTIFIRHWRNMLMNQSLKMKFTHKY